MDAIFNRFQLAAGPRASGRFTVVAACEDSLTESRVTEFCRNLASRLGGEHPVIKHVWLLSELRTRPLCAIAAQEAATADLVIVSLHPARNIPDEIARWLDLWRAHKIKSHSPLLALFDPASDGVSALLQSALEDIARKAKTEFLVQSGEHVEVLD